MVIPNVLADRYVSSDMNQIFDPKERVLAERRFWLAVLDAQIQAGLDADATVLDDYRAEIENIDLDSIRARETKLKHDIPARLHEFNELAGHQHLHKGMTSRDLSENVEQLLNLKAIKLLESRMLSLLNLLSERAVEFADVAIVARTHNVPAQPTTLGKRFAQLGEEMLSAYNVLLSFIDRYQIRGIKGPVGSQQDQLNLLGSSESVNFVEKTVAESFGISATQNAVGQVYPRSLDFEMASTLFQLGAAPSNFALLVRLMAAHDLATEGFAEGQVGSSAMPHKMNARSCERINGLYAVLKGYLDMAASLSGNQWNEGDVSCSVVRRVALPNLFFTIDGIFETTFSVLKGFRIFPKMLELELEKYLPFLSTTTLLMHAVKKGMGRETAHEIIKEHAVATAIAVRDDGSSSSILFEKLGNDERFLATAEELASLVDSPNDLLGNIDSQIKTFTAKVAEVVKGRESELAYVGEDIL